MSVTKEFHRLLKRVRKLTDGQASISDIDWDDGNLSKFYVTIIPNNGLYKSGKFKFRIGIPDEYPAIPPVVWCNTEIYHPNIDTRDIDVSDEGTNVCLNVLESGTWSSSFGLEGTILGLLFLMHNPNLEDPLSSHFEGNDDDECFRENVKKYMAGEKLFGDVLFDKDFKVIDGILIEETVNSVLSETKSEASSIIEDDSQSINKDDVPTNDIKHTDNGENSEDEHLSENYSGNANGSADNLANKGSLNDAIEKKNKQVMDNTDEVNEITMEGAIGCQEAVDKVDDDESDKCDIELVNIDGDCVFFIHKSASDVDENMADEQETENMTEVEQYKPDPEQTDDGHRNSQDEVCTSNTNEIISEVCEDASCSFTTLNTTCNIEDIANDGISSQTDDSEIKTLMSDIEIDKQRRNNPSHQTDTVCGCGAWYTFRTTLSKIAHTIGHNKLYRDINF
ncbi:uncharacterized protein LOC132759302 [Ruditapes philippinarum]|uniref:uncharacterized protein LOC132759302 n=1 Tax=Ruditapes philippinarum TaxID=129788 RepID=UPI00295A7DE4|nr:uncharacterized protein LOC132759302 [Ruditapes philippinarum]